MQRAVPLLKHEHASKLAEIEILAQLPNEQFFLRTLSPLPTLSFPPQPAELELILQPLRLQVMVISTLETQLFSQPQLAASAQ